MSVLFYFRPNSVAKLPGPLGLAQCQASVEKTQKHRKAIPAELSFDNVIHNRALPPCSLDDFMQYLVHVSRDAENLQFWLWVQDYIKRFFAIPRSEQALSPPWNAANVAQAAAKIRNQPPKAFGKSKMSLAEFLVSLDGLDDTRPLIVARPFDMESLVSGETSSDRSVTGSVGDANAQPGLKCEAPTIQPFRAEINRIVCHYLAPDAPRELNLSERDRTAILRALQHTTHPSALSAVADMVEANLRGQSHPNFIRWSICNVNKPRVLAVRSAAIAHVVAGIIIGVFLVLSGGSRWWRLISGLLFLIGFSIGMAAHKGVCVVIQFGHTRALRPWEQFGDHMSSAYLMNTLDEDWSLSTDDRVITGHRFEKGVLFDPFGTPNSERYDVWADRYRKIPLRRKIFSPQIWIQDQTIRELQERIVVESYLWSICISVSLTTLFLVLPECNLL